MKSSALITLLFGLPLLLNSCRDSADTTEAKAPPIVAPELKSNQLAKAPSALLKSASESQINWQIWEPKLLEMAADSQRLIYALITSTRYPATYTVLENLERRPGVVRRLNEDFVPVLVDLDICREASLIATILSSETRAPIDFPCVLILSPAGDPVSWQPLGLREGASIQTYFDNTLEVVQRLWLESHDYVVADSRQKNKLRQQRMAALDQVVLPREERISRYQAGIRQLTSLFDADLGAISEVGGVFPSPVLACLSGAATHEVLPESLRQRAARSASGMFESIHKSAIIDPLDGGIFTARFGPSWNLPLFIRDCATQAQAVRSLATFHQSLGNAEALDIALNAIAFAEDHYATPEGLFMLSDIASKALTEDWLWTLEEVRDVLDEDEFRVWRALTELNHLGNLPSEADPTRRFFRLNSLAMRNTPEEVGKALGMSPNRVRTFVESGRKKLLKARARKVETTPLEPTPSASASFQMISAYAALYTSTGDPAWRDKAIQLGRACREQFGENRFLNERPGKDPGMIGDSRANTYALATRASIDLGSVTLDDGWYLWAQDLVSLMGENFITEDGRLAETRDASRVIGITLSDRIMVFEESTVGITRSNLQRLRVVGFQTPPALGDLMNSLPPADEAPVVFTDSLQALAFDVDHVLLKVPDGADAALADAVATLPFHRFARRRTDDTENHVTLDEASGANRTLTEASAVEELERPLELP